jgi:hypothetical protein
VAKDLDAAHRELTAKVMGREGVSGTAIGQHRGKPCLKVYTSGGGARASIPKSVGGYPVVVETTGAFKRL